LLHFVLFAVFPIFQGFFTFPSPVLQLFHAFTSCNKLVKAEKVRLIRPPAAATFPQGEGIEGDASSACCAGPFGDAPHPDAFPSAGGAAGEGGSEADG